MVSIYLCRRTAHIFPRRLRAGRDPRPEFPGGLGGTWRSPSLHHMPHQDKTCRRHNIRQQTPNPANYQPNLQQSLQDRSPISGQKHDRSPSPPHRETCAQWQLTRRRARLLLWVCRGDARNGTILLLVGPRGRRDVGKLTSRSSTLSGRKSAGARPPSKKGRW